MRTLLRIFKTPHYTLYLQAHDDYKLFYGIDKFVADHVLAYKTINWCLRTRGL